MLSTLFSNHGILGINARNLLYVTPFNPKKATAFADDKLKTKAFLSARGIPTARIFARIENREQLRAFDLSQLPDECVLKPNLGFGGEGIVILKGRTKDGYFLKSGKNVLSHTDLKAHIEDILDGKFSLGGRRDTAFFEQILKPHECFAPFRPVGLPDLRIIVFNLVPVMAMLRIPTAVSEGKANLHLGGIGIGIDMAKGTTTYAAQYHHMITALPHGGTPSGIQIPFWHDILLISSRIQKITNIGYLAVDITIDEQMGPSVLEVNARAGLNVQVANLAPLRRRLNRVQGIKVTTPEKGVRIGQDLFGEEVHAKKEKQDTDEKPVLGLQESIVITADGESFEEACRIGSEQERTMFHPELIAELKEHGAIEVQDKKKTQYRVKFVLGGKKIQTLVTVAPDLAGPERAVIGRRDLSGYLIDPAKQSSQSALLRSSKKVDLRVMDKTLAEVDRQLLLLKYLKPVNLEEEYQRALSDPQYNPVFTYRELDIDVPDLHKKLDITISDLSPLGQLLEKKRQELLQRLALLEVRGEPDAFTEQSIALFGKPNSSLIRTAEAQLHNRGACELPEPEDSWLSDEEAAQRFRSVLDQYSLHDWTVAVRKIVARVTVGGTHIYIRKGVRFPQSDVDALIKHEIETHVLTAENGKNQPYKLLRRGFSGYLDTQEGLATYNQNMVYGEFHEKRYNSQRNLLGLQFALNHSFAETRLYLQEELGYDPEKTISQSIAMKRGLRDTSESGALTKSIVYFRGLRSIEEFVEKGGDLSLLYIGKFALEDLELVQKLPDLQKPVLLPDFLREAIVSSTKPPKKKQKKKKDTVSETVEE